MSRSGSLRRNRAYARLWVAHVTSGAGNALTAVALPLAAVLVLGATPAQMGMLAAAGSLPNLLFGLVAGVWVDRVRRKPVLVWCDVGRALLLATVPLAAWLGRLSLAYLIAVAFAAGALTVFFQIAAISLLPALVEKRSLVAANSRLSASEALLAIAGPVAAGGLVQRITAPGAILIDAVSYLLSALALSGLREDVGPDESGGKEAASCAAGKRLRRELARAASEIGEGMRELARTPLLKALTVTSTVGMLAGAVTAAVQMLFLVDQLQFTPVLIGGVLACGGGGSLLGALLAGRAGRLWHVGGNLALGKLLWIAGSLLLACADLTGRELIAAGAALALGGMGVSLYIVNQVSLRQSVTRARLLGRVTAARRFVLFGASTLGALAGGGLGETVGLRTTLLVGVGALALELALLLCSPIRKARVD